MNLCRWLKPSITVNIFISRWRDWIEPLGVSSRWSSLQSRSWGKVCFSFCEFHLLGGAAMVITLASHQRGPHSIPRGDVICGLSLLLVLVLAPRVFFSGLSGFPPSTKNNIPNSNSTRKQWKGESPRGFYSNSYLFFLFITKWTNFLRCSVTKSKITRKENNTQ